MTFQYFFFDTYVGYFLQMVPFAAAAALGVGMWKYRRGATKCRSIFAGLLVAYLVGLVGVTLLLRVIGLMWYWLIYHHSGGGAWFFEWTYNFVPDFWNHFARENLVNALMFVPFGILYPLAGKEGTFLKTMKCGTGVILSIELLQPVFGRAFDINDVILNLCGVACSAGVFFALRKLCHSK